MKSVKPGRGPSAMGAVGALFAAIFGVVFVIIGIIQAIYNFKNATGKNRYSEFDIVDSREEPDPLAQRLGLEQEDTAPNGSEADSGDFRYCPYCGARLGDGFTFCGKCGKRLPEEP